MPLDFGFASGFWVSLLSGQQAVSYIWVGKQCLRVGLLHPPAIVQFTNYLVIFYSIPTLDHVLFCAAGPRGSLLRPGCRGEQRQPSNARESRVSTIRPGLYHDLSGDDDDNGGGSPPSGDVV